GWAIGMFAAGGTALLVFGPLLAGLLLEVASWRWVFLVTLPVLLVAWIVGRRCITPSRGAADAPATSWGTMRDPLLLASLAALFAIEFAVFGATVPLTLYLQHGLEQSAVTAGVLIALAGIGTPLLSVTAGRVSDRRGPRTLVVGGLVLAAAGLALLALLAPIGGVAPLIPGLAAFALARPAVFTPAGTGPFLALGDAQRAFAASLGTEARQCGAVLGAAVAGAVFAEVNGVALVDGDVTQVAGFVASVVVAAVVCAAAAVVAWRWLPRTSTPS
ncbi:MAG: MFS transporter, partial [Pseudonocardia sp.]